MKKGISRIAAIVAAVALAMCMAVVLAACKDNGGSGKNPGDAVKIGVLVSDASGEEALGFKKYYEEYIHGQYSNVTFVYSPALADAAAEKSQIETFAAQGCDAIISFAAGDRAAQIQACEDAKVYYAVATGMLDDAQYATYKGYRYFVGQIGPSMDTEYETGKAMGKYFKDTKQVSKVAIYGAFIPNPMHVYRFAGVLEGLGLTYDGASGKDVVSKIGQSVDGTKISGAVSVDYFAGYTGSSDMIDAVIERNPDAVISVGMATTFFTQKLNEASIEFGDIDSFTAANGTAMESGKLVYLAGKYSSSIGPIFAAVMSSVYGAPIRAEGDTAISLGQDYWVATSSAQFKKFQEADSAANPIFNKSLLDTVIANKDKSVTFADFKKFVETDRTPQV